MNQIVWVLEYHDHIRDEIRVRHFITTFESRDGGIANLDLYTVSPMEWQEIEGESRETWSCMNASGAVELFLTETHMDDREELESIARFFDGGGIEATR